MSEELSTDQGFSVWRGRLRSLGADRLRAIQPEFLFGAGIAVALLSYAAPLVFPAAAVLLFAKVGGALVEDFGVAMTGAFWLQTLLFAGASAVSVSLWRLRVSDPTGEPVTEQEAPELYALVEEMRAAFKAPAIDSIHVTEEARLRVYRVPRTGYPVLFRPVLLIGMPSLQCLGIDQFKCLLASCMGQVSVVRADVAAWLGHVACTCEQYRAAAAGQLSPAALFYRAFLFVYQPMLSALVRQSRRQRQAYCDQYPLEIASDDLVVEMIAGEVVMLRFLEEYYWPTVYRTADHSSAPDFKVFRNLESIFQRRATHDLVQVWIRDAFVGKWRSGDCDPGLRSRLLEIGHSEIAYTRPAAPTAAQTLLGNSLQHVIERCDLRWAEDHRGEWRERHDKAQRQFARLGTLREALQRDGLHGEDAIAYAALVKRYGTADEATAAYEAILAQNQADPRIIFGVGKYHLSRNDSRGVKLLERAMSMDKRYVDPACRLISAFTAQLRTRQRQGRHGKSAMSIPRGS